MTTGPKGYSEIRDSSKNHKCPIQGRLARYSRKSMERTDAYWSIFLPMGDWGALLSSLILRCLLCGKVFVEKPPSQNESSSFEQSQKLQVLLIWLHLPILYYSQCESADHFQVCQRVTEVIRSGTRPDMS